MAGWRGCRQQLPGLSASQALPDLAWPTMEGDGSNYSLRLRIGPTLKLPIDSWSNDRVSEHDILGGHFRASAQRADSTEGPILVLQDTTTFSYQRERPELIGYTGKTATRPDKDGRTKPLTQCGILMHSSLAVTADGLPLGLTATSSGPAASLRAARRSSVKSIRRACRLRRRKAIAGWRTCASRSRRIEAANRRSARQSHLRVLHPELADILADDDPSLRTRDACASGPHADRSDASRSACQRHHRHRQRTATTAQCGQARSTRRLSGTRQRSSAWQHRYVARHASPH